LAGYEVRGLASEFLQDGRSAVVDGVPDHSSCARAGHRQIWKPKLRVVGKSETFGDR
jgi:hypothetical protein